MTRTNQYKLTLVTLNKLLVSHYIIFGRRERVDVLSL